MKSWNQISVYSLILFFSSITNAMAYIDPGSGSVVMTAIIGFIAAIGYTFRKYFYKILRVFLKKDSEDDSEI